MVRSAANFGQFQWLRCGALKGHFFDEVFEVGPLGVGIEMVKGRHGLLEDLGCGYTLGGLLQGRP